MGTFKQSANIALEKVKKNIIIILVQN